LPPEDEPEEELLEEEAPRSNRAFVFIAIAMGGLILLGVLALVGSMLFIVPARKQASIAAITQTVAAATAEAEAWTPTPLPTATPLLPTFTPTLPPTETPLPTATATRVVQDPNAPRAATSTPTPSSAYSEWDSTTPQAGLGGLGIASIAVGLTGIVFAARKLRKPK
jgi:hypothetical protein